jgi:hypothetical protein
LTHTRPLAPTAISYARYFPEVRTSVKRDQKRPTLTIHVLKRRQKQRSPVPGTYPNN